MAQDKILKFAIDGVEVPSPGIDGTSFKDIDISRSYDDINGIFRDKLIRYRKQITWSYKAMNKQKLEEFYINKIRKHIEEVKNREFIVTTPYPGRGNIDVKCYLGTPVEIKPVQSDKYKGITYWQFNLIWTEIEGTSLL